MKQNIYSLQPYYFHVLIPLFVLVLPISIVWSQGSQTFLQPDETGIRVTLSATGHSTGHIANLSIFNGSSEKVEMTLPSGIITSDGSSQGYVVPDPVMCSVPPSQTIHIAVNGYCLDHFLPVPRLGQDLPMPTQWSGLPHIKDNPFEKDPFDSIRVHTGGDSTAFKPMGAESTAEGGKVSTTPKQPSLDVVGSETTHVTDGQRKYVSRTPAEDARLLDEVGKIIRSVDSLQQKGISKTPLTKNPPVEKSVITQHTIWVAASPTAQPYTMADICDDLDQAWQSVPGAGNGKPTPSDKATLLDAIFKAGSGAGISSFLPAPPTSGGQRPQSFPSSGHPVEQTIKVTGTGRTTGHIADITLRNPTDQPVMARVGTGSFYIPSSGQYQPYIVPDMPPVALGPGETQTVPVYGYCVDIHRPPVPSGSGLPDIKEWTSVPGPLPDDLPANTITIPTRLSPPVGDALKIISKSVPPVLTGSDPDCIPYDVHTPFIPLVPGTAIPLPDPGIFDTPGDAYLLAPVLLTTIQRITNAYDELRVQGEIITPFSGNPDREREAVIQQTFWMYTGVMDGGSYDKKDFFANTVRQFEDNTRRDYEALPPEQKEKIESGVDDFWNSFEAVGVEAKVIHVADPRAATVPPQGWDAYPSTQQKQPPLPVASADDRTTQPVPPPEYPKVPPEAEKECNPQFRLDVAPPIRGGLNPKCVGTFRIAKGEFIPLVAEGADADHIYFDCIPVHGCPESGSQRKEGLTSCVSYYWKSIGGAEYSDGFISGTSADMGEMNLDELRNPNRFTKAILYQHAEVTREKPSVRSRLQLNISDGCSSQVEDEDLELMIDLFVHLVEGTSADSVEITIVAPVFDAYNNPVKTEVLGTCEAKPLQWTQTKDLDIKTTSQRMFEKSKTILSATTSDVDQLELRCSSSCKGSIKKMTLPDEVILQWEILSGGGCFMTGPNTCNETTWGKDVVFLALTLDDFTDSATVKIIVKAYNQGGGTDPYHRTPVISKAVDVLDTDTLTIKVLCRTRKTSVLIGWADRLWDHDDPDHIDTLLNTSQSATIPYNRECRVELNQAIAGWSDETRYFKIDGSGFVPSVWFGYRHLYAVGNIVHLYDYGMISDLDIPTSATDWLEEFQKMMLWSEAYGKMFAWLLHELPQLREEEAPEFFNELAKGLGIDPEVWKKGNLDEFTRNEMINLMLKNLQEGNFTQNRELGFIFSSWVLSPSGEGDCDTSCPVDVSHLTMMTLGDSDHYYRRTSQVIVTRQVGNQIVHEPHAFEKELKGERFPR